MQTKYFPTLLTRLANQKKYPCLILDGGMGTSLNDEGLNEYDAWSAPRRINETYIRNSVKKVLCDFLDSGVDILTANTYDSCGSFLTKNGTEQIYKNQWVFDNLDLAKEVIDEFMAPKSCDVPRPLLAMSVGSFATTIPRRAETANREHNDKDDCFRGEGYGFKASDIRLYFNARLEEDILHHASKCDVAVIAFETVGDLLEVKIICEVLNSKADLLNEKALSTWVTLTCGTEDTVDTGGSVTSCIEVLAACPQVTGVGVNCTEPHLVAPIIGKIKQVLKDCNAEEKLIVVYPNSGETYLCRGLQDGETDHWKKHSMYEDWKYADAAKEWIDSGANIVGGCCRITADDIAELVENLGRV